MQREENIVEELRLISAFVAAISRQMPYQVPDGYFEDLAARIMERVKQHPYTVPQGYFEEFAGKLLARIKAGQEGDPREELSVLSPLLDRIDKQHPYQAPEGYFSDLTGNVLSGVQAIEFVHDELEHQPSLITGLRDKAVYRAPEGYFEGFAATVLTRLKQQAAPAEARVSPAMIIPGRQATVISIRKSAGWWKYAAAAVVAGLILTAGWMGLHMNPGKTISGNDLTNGLAKVSDQEILNYLDNQNIPVAETMANSTATLDINDADIKNILGNVSDTELKDYLEDNAGTKDLVTN